LSEEISDFTAAHADISGRNVCICSNMSGEFCHESLAETHYFRIGFALRIEIRTAFSAAHRQSCQGILENLFKSQELQNRSIYTWMEAETAFVRSDSGIELYAVTSVYLNISIVIFP